MSFKADPLLGTVSTLLADDSASVKDLRAGLAALLQRCADQERLLERVTRLSDGFQRAERDRGADYLKHYLNEVKRVEKIVRISDRYQEMLRELNSRLTCMANTDYLTSLVNRRFACEQLESALDLARRYRRPLCLAVIDIDFFKLVNDRFGHHVGDQAICAVAKLLAQSVREGDLCARWGGEEFLLIFPATALPEAFSLVEEVRQCVAAANLPVDDRTSLNFSVSIGLAQFDGGELAHELIRRVDAALYQAKRSGRNRSQVAG